MASIVKVKEMICPNCGGELIGVGRYRNSAKCRYCESVFMVVDNEVADDKSADEFIGGETTRRIIPFKVTREKFERMALEWLGSGDCLPEDVVLSLIFKNTREVYFPVYLYEGEFNIRIAVR